VIELGAVHFEKAFACRVSAFVPDGTGSLRRAYGSPELGEPTEHDRSISQWVWSNHKEAGLGTDTLSSSPALYVPLMAPGGIEGVLGLRPAHTERFDDLEQRRQVDAFAAQLALSLERVELAEETEKAHREVEREQLRSSLLSCVSHDLRTPLAVITGAASTLVMDGNVLDSGTRADLMKTILEESERLNRLIRNLLDMTQLESGTVRLRKEWASFEEVLGAALNRVEDRLGDREVRVDIPRDLPLVPFDPFLIEQVLINLLENAAKYSSGPIEIRASMMPEELLVDVRDAGPGIPRGEEERVFEKFHRAVREGSPAGVGLGLAICRAIVAVHGGRIWARNCEDGGASFQFLLPLVGEPPSLVPAEAPEPQAEEATS
jgi:two-component system, OmpR family, sensor histidine kinase KdpD